MRVWKIGLANLGAMVLLGAGAGMAQAVVDTSTYMLPAKVRDFAEKNKDPLYSPGHPMFFGEGNTATCQSDVDTTVAYRISETDEPDPRFTGDQRGPTLLIPVKSNFSACFPSPEKFSDWFNDKPGVNRPFKVNLPFVNIPGTDLYHFEDGAFFPIDNGKSFSALGSESAPFGHLLPNSLANHNFGFTLEFHTEFTYHANKNQVFNFNGDDDIWVFINDQRAVDIGGIHGKIEKQITLDQIATKFKLIDGQKYKLDCFFAERNPTSSSLEITTNLVIPPRATAPTITGDSLFIGSTQVTITALANLTIRYTTDGSEPDENSDIYSGPFTISSTKTVKAYTTHPDLRPSNSVSKLFEKQNSDLGTIVATPPSGTSFVGSVLVSLSIPGHPTTLPTPNIFYTLDGITEPTIASEPYKAGNPILIPANTTLKARAFLVDFDPSAILTAVYTRLADVTKAVYVDNNGDGAIDGAIIRLDIPVAAVPASVKLLDPFNKAPYVATANQITRSADGTTLTVSFPLNPFTPGITTFATAPLGSFPTPVGYTDKNFKIEDSVGPVPIKAVAINKVNPDDKASIDITFSEPINITGLAETNSWPFDIIRPGGMQGKNVVIESIVASGQANTYRFTFSSGSTAYPVYIDSLTLAPSPLVQDMGGAKGVPGGKRIAVTGSPQTVANNLDIKPISAIEKGPQLPPIAWSKEVKDNFGVVGEPVVPGATLCIDCKPGRETIFLSKEPLPAWIISSKFAFTYKFNIYDNLGQYVTKTEGEVTEDMMQKIARDKNGVRNVTFRWVPVAHNGAPAGTGAYILKGIITNKQANVGRGSQGEPLTVETRPISVVKKFGYVRRRS